MKIEIIVAPDGSARIETKGYTGESCRDASRFLEGALGRQTAETLTSEYYCSTNQVNVEQQRR